MNKSLDAIREYMNLAYSSGRAYKSSLAFDSMRGIEIRRATLELAGSDATDPTKRVLDVGCGEGGIASFWPHRNVVGVDISQAAIERARRNHPDVEWHAIPAEGLCGLDLGTFSLAVAQESVEHWTEVEAPLRAIRNLLQPDGALIITTPNRSSLHCRIARKLGIQVPYCSNDHTHEFEFDELIDVVLSAGFRRVRSIGVHLAPYWAIDEFGTRIRTLTDHDEEVNAWLNEIGREVPKYAFIQCHRFEVA